MKRIIVVLVMFCSPSLAKADELFGIYAGIGFGKFGLDKFGADAQLGFKVRGLKYCPVGLEAAVVVPYGLEIAAPIYLVNTWRFKFHVILPFMGVEIPFGRTQISVPWLERGREFNLVIGTGMEIVFQGREIFKIRRVFFKAMSFNLDWKVFAPNPLYVFPNFMDYGAMVYKQAAEEGQIWLGVTFWL